MLPSHLPRSASTSVARLCETCQVLVFNDEGGHSENTGDGKPFLQLRSTKPESDDTAEQFLPLETTTIEDEFPDLPRLRQSSEEGCDFCKLLRAEIIKHYLDCHAPVRIEMGYLWEHNSFTGTGLSVFRVRLERSSYESWFDLTYDTFLFTVESNDGM